ncbi:MAG: hypothetical protein J6E42_10135 [Firmicutes bacterium]|nr:hypothetical protein [Bacillota bacterium]
MKPQVKWTIAITVLVLFMFCLTGCGKSAEEINSEFSEILSDKATPKTMEKAEEYAEKYAKKLSTDGATNMVAQLEDYLIQYINTDRDDVQVQSLAAYFDKESGEVDEDRIKDVDTKEYYERLTKVHIHPVYFEDRVQLRINYTTLNETFGAVIDPALSRLYEIKVWITDNPATKNASLQIGYDQLLERALAVEELIDEYPDYVLIAEEVEWLYSTYLDLIMMGTTNTPIFDYATGAFNEQAEQAYRTFMKENKATTIAWALNEYFKYLESIDYTMNYKDSTTSKLFFDSCYGIRVAAEKRVFEQNELYE